MKIELGLSVLSKRETLLGIQLSTHNGVNADDGELYSERVVEFSIGIIFAILTIGFVTTGEKIDMPDNLKESFDNIEKQIKAHKQDKDDK